MVLSAEDIGAQLNTDRAVRVVQHAATMEWAPSPSPSVWRRRLGLEGPVESGRVTSIVRYDANSNFREHGHPDGEEILVLSGAWQDANGNHPAGTFMLNPEGFRHTPASKDGCVLFVKLRQHGGEGRSHQRLALPEIPWAPGPDAASCVKVMYDDASGHHTEKIRVERWQANATVTRSSSHVTEYLVLSGSCEEGGEALVEYSWLRIPPGNKCVFKTGPEGTEVYVKEGEWIAPGATVS